MKYNYQGWKGSYIDVYFHNWDNGEWVNISFIHYLWLKIKGFKIRKLLNKQD